MLRVHDVPMNGELMVNIKTLRSHCCKQASCDSQTRNFTTVGTPPNALNWLDKAPKLDSIYQRQYNWDGDEGRLQVYYSKTVIGSRNL